MTQDGLIQAFTNPTLFANGVGTVGVGGSSARRPIRL